MDRKPWIVVVVVAHGGMDNQQGRLVQLW